MIFRRDYGNPFWRGFVHAVGIFLYSIFITLTLLSLGELFQAEIGVGVRLGIWVFISLLSFGITAWLLFYKPMKLVLHHKFTSAAVMLGSSLGWLMIFFLVLLIGFLIS